MRLKTPNLSMRHWWLSMAALSLAIALITAALVRHDLAQQRQRAGERLHAQAAFRAGQIAGWVATQMRLADFLEDSTSLAELFKRWQDDGEPGAGALLLDRAVELRRAMDTDSTLIVDTAGAVLAREVEDGEADNPALRRTVELALARHGAMHSTLYRQAGARPELRLDIVIPLLMTGPVPRGAVVMRIDPRRVLTPLLDVNLARGESNRSLLWHRVGDTVVNLSDTLQAPRPAGSIVEPLGTSRLPVARVMRGEQPAGTPFEGTDYRGAAVFASVVPVAGTDWWLASKADIDEIEAPAWASARWAAAAAALLTLGIALASRLMMQHRALARSAVAQHEQRERLTTLGLLEAISDSTSDSIYAKDLGGRYIFCNRAAAALLGTSPQAVTGLRNDQLFDTAIAATRDAEDARALHEPRPETLERLQSPAGEVVLTTARGPLFDAEGRLIGMLGLSRDVTERLRSERALQDSEAHYRSVVSVLDEGILVCDLSGKVIICNPAAARMAGVDVADWEGGAITPSGWTMLDETGAAIPDAKLPARIVLAGGPPQHRVLMTRLCPDGQRRHFEVNALPVTHLDSGETIGVVTSFSDVTERTRNRAALEAHRQEMESLIDRRTVDLWTANRALVAANAELAASRDEARSASRAKSAFVANMSHEIRTPMNAIIGLTHVLARDPRDSLQRERLDKIGVAAQHLLQVINDILDLSKIEAGKLTLELADFSRDEMLARVFDMVSERAAAKGVELVLDTDHMPTRLCGDATRLAQMLINLLSNAVKFTSSGWIRLKGVPLVDEGARLKLRFEVQDTGEGIDAERQAELFSAFEQGDSSITRRHGGTGLGLSLTKQLALAMDGSVGMHSERGVGSTFWFEVWLAPAHAAAPRALPVSMRGLRALLVDDLAEARAGIAGQLDALGLQVDSLPGGAEALAKVGAEMARGRPYDVLLIDMRMDGMDGVETLERLRALLGAGLPPSILVTAAIDDETRARAAAARFNEVLLKPITASALQDSLRQVLRRQGAPVEPQAAGPGQLNEAAVRARHRGQRLLLVEDNEVNREVAEELIAHAGLVVESAADGASAIELALSRHYDLILMDMQMPILDGLAATRAIRARAGAATPIIAMTANAFAEDRLACLEAGMNDHVAKPVDPALLYEMLLRWLPLPGHTKGAGGV